MYVTARKAGIEPTLTVLETALLPLEDFRKNRLPDFSVNLGFGELRMQAFARLAQDFRSFLLSNQRARALVDLVEEFARARRPKRFIANNEY